MWAKAGILFNTSFLAANSGCLLRDLRLNYPRRDSGGSGHPIIEWMCKFCQSVHFHSAIMISRCFAYLVGSKSWPWADLHLLRLLLLTPTTDYQVVYCKNYPTCKASLSQKASKLSFTTTLAKKNGGLAYIVVRKKQRFFEPQEISSASFQTMK